MRVNPGVVNNPAALDALRDLAVGRAYSQGLLTQEATRAPFSESPGSTYGSLSPKTPEASAEQIAIGQRLGLTAEQISKTNALFEKYGVYRG